jgi:hypothetical protein
VLAQAKQPLAALVKPSGGKVLQTRTVGCSPAIAVRHDPVAGWLHERGRRDLQSRNAVRNAVAGPVCRLVVTT